MSRARWHGVMLCAALAAGCSSRPADVPAPDIGVLARFSDACPDLRGSYRIARDNGRQLVLPGQLLRNAVKPARFHSILSIDSLDADGMTLRSRATGADLRGAMQRWREDNDYGYALWSRALVARSTGNALVLERRPGAGAPVAPATLPPSFAFRIDARHYRCEGGWLILDGEPEPDSGSIDTAEVRMTRAEDGGLVASWRFTVEQSFSIWCGDSCTPDLPLPDAHKENWLHLPPAPAVPDTPVDWAALIADDPRPASVRDRYVEGTQLRMLTAADLAAKRRPAGASPAAAAAVAGTPSDPAPAPQQQSDAGQEARWHEHLGPVMPQGTSIAALRCDPRHCVLTGYATAMTPVSNLMRALDVEHRAGSELMLIERDGDERYRFEVQLPPEP